MSADLVIVANRLPVDRVERPDGTPGWRGSPGGLVTAVEPVMLAFVKRDGKIFLFWSTESMSNHVDTVWPYWNLLDFTPQGRPDRDTPPQKFRSEFLEKNYLNG